MQGWDGGGERTSPLAWVGRVATILQGVEGDFVEEEVLDRRTESGLNQLSEEKESKQEPEFCEDWEA